MIVKGLCSKAPSLAIDIDMDAFQYFKNSNLAGMTIPL